LFAVSFLLDYNAFMKRNHLARFEEIAQRLLEGTFARLFAGRLRPTEVANALAHALEDHAVLQPGGAPHAPNHYWVSLNPEDFDALLAQQPDLAEDLARHLVGLARELGFLLPDPPEVRLQSFADVPLHQVRVNARWIAAEGEPTGERGGVTRQMPSAGSLDGKGGTVPPTRPFLIVEGQRHVALSAPTVTLGRSLSNEIIIEDARVSRRHAQLRRRYNRYIVYDLGSTGGTTVNGYPIQECVLEAGDVISLAGVEIIYGEDASEPGPPPRETTSTPPYQRSLLPETGELPPIPKDRSET
jgi:pSer/pThr/pTyr-binding forkhead associated (FHA) protein